MASTCSNTTKLLRTVMLALSSTILLSGCGLFSFGDSGSTPTKAHKVVSTAYSQLGKSYRSGGASPSKGFDCSGLVYWVYRKNGYKIPRVTTDQARFGKGVAKGNVREGDIVVFRIAQSPRGLHTGIYTGKNNFIHSPSKGKKVKIDSINKDYWKKRLVAIRRVVL